MPRVRREKERDTRDFDTTSLRENGNHGQILHRDYSAHFFRWSFAKRFIKRTDHVLEVGCGPDRPLYKLLFRNVQPYAASYVGVDLNALPPCDHARSTFLGEFNFVKDWKRLQQLTDPRGSGAPLVPEGGFDVAINMEVIEHVAVEHGKTMLKGLFSLLRPGGVLLLSTPCYDGVRHAANHIHEATVPELQKNLEKTGFVVERRYGTFMDIKHIGKVESDRCSKAAIAEVKKALSEYFDNDAISNIFGPLYQDSARNNLWVCRKPA